MMAAYKKKTGTDPTNFAVQAHDATLVLLDAIQKAGSLDPRSPEDPGRAREHGVRDRVGHPQVHPARRGAPDAHPDRGGADPVRQEGADLPGVGRGGRGRQVRAGAPYAWDKK
jgi:hypothetical protein